MNLLRVTRWSGSCLIGIVPFTATLLHAQGTIRVDAEHQTVTLADGRGDLVLRLNHARRCVLDRVVVRGREVAACVSSGERLAGSWITTETGISSPSVSVRDSTLTVEGIRFGTASSEVRETWRFTVQADAIVWQIVRSRAEAATLDDSAFPAWSFPAMTTWTGGLLDTGGVVWNRYLETPDATYGAHAGTVTFWNREKRDCLRITPNLPNGSHGSVRFSHGKDGRFTFHHSVSAVERKPKHALCRFLPDRQDLWAPFRVEAGDVDVRFTLRALDYDQAYDRGTFPGLKGEGIRELLHTAARYGVIDDRLVGGNGWRSGYVCLHEQFFAEIGLALADPDYTANHARALDHARDHAIGPDGRVKARWKYDAADAMPGTYDASGFYEAQWGWLLDSQPDHVINVVGVFDLTGDRAWLAGQKSACERALEYLMRREVGHCGLVAMKTDSRTAGKSSDWIDIVWASWENALVNAELYYALTLWADAEEVLGDSARAATYREFAARSKASFNRPVAEGGFWSPGNRWYVHWREKDGSGHGDNLVIPVNFAAIAYGLCDDPTRQKAILDRIEAGMREEGLFAWPLCFLPYAPDEGSAGAKFPDYENGDIFLSWGELGVRAYAAHDPALALGYVEKALARYDEDGLAFQRYLRRSQRGAGDDILSGNCMAVVGLYRDLYGIRPKHDRLCLDPHLPAKLAGTRLKYPLRGRTYVIDLSPANYAVTVGCGTLASDRPFAIAATDTELCYFPGASAEWALRVAHGGQPLEVRVGAWPEANDAQRAWTETSPRAEGTTRYTVTGLRPLATYELEVDGSGARTLRADAGGRLGFDHARSRAGRSEMQLLPVPR